MDRTIDVEIAMQSSRHPIHLPIISCQSSRVALSVDYAAKLPGAFPSLRLAGIILRTLLLHSLQPFTLQ